MSEFTAVLETLGLAPFVTPVDFDSWTKWSFNPAYPSYPSDEQSVTSSASGFDSMKSPTVETVGDARGYLGVPVHGKFETMEMMSEGSFESFTGQKIGSDLEDRIPRRGYFADEPMIRTTTTAPERRPFNPFEDEDELVLPSWPQKKMTNSARPYWDLGLHAEDVTASVTAPERRPFNPFDDEDEVFLPPSSQEKMTNSAKPCWDLGLHSENVTTWTYAECAERNAASESGVKATASKQAEVGEGTGLIERDERSTSDELSNEGQSTKASTSSVGDPTEDREEGQAGQTARELRLEVAQFIRERTIYRKDKAGAAKRQHLNLNDDSVRRAFLSTENVPAGAAPATLQLMNGFRRQVGKPLVFIDELTEFTLLDLMVHGGSGRLGERA